MSKTDWAILILTLLAIVIYGIYKSRTTRDIQGYFLDNRSMPWFLVLFGIMGTQASAVTYLTGPGQSYSDGLRFVQYYFGLPLAMIVIAVFFVPQYSKLKVVTAYEFLEHRFDVRTRTLTSFLFLISRGLSTGISIYAPSIVLSSIMGWNIYYTNLVMGGVLIIYTLSGGARAIAHTQKLQMLIVFTALFLTGYLAVHLLPGEHGFQDALHVAGRNGKMNIITNGLDNSGFNWKDKYNIWSGLIGGFFLALSYFGTDHSQVGRYITAANVKESRIGLLLNGIVKVPMQFFILLLGILIFSYYQFHRAPVYFNESNKELALQTAYADQLNEIEQQYDLAIKNRDLKQAETQRAAYKSVLTRALPGEEVNDNNYIFLQFVKDNLPVGLTGLLFAVIFLSAWGSIAAALNSLAACTVVDFHQRLFKDGSKIENEYAVSRWYTLGWGVFAIVVAMFSQNIGQTLIETVNVLGSLFYGVILGIFLVAFWFKRIGGRAVFIAGVISEIIVILVYKADVISFLWLNVIGALAVISLGFFLELILPAKKNAAA
jgi:SSS family transporter